MGGLLLLIGSLPLVVALPELGLPMILVALRLLAVEPSGQPAATPGSPGARSSSGWLRAIRPTRVALSVPLLALIALTGSLLGFD